MIFDKRTMQEAKKIAEQIGKVQESNMSRIIDSESGMLNNRLKPRDYIIFMAVLQQYYAETCEISVNLRTLDIDGGIPYVELTLKAYKEDSPWSARFFGQQPIGMMALSIDVNHDEHLTVNKSYTINEVALGLNRNLFNTIVRIMYPHDTVRVVNDN